MDSTCAIKWPTGCAEKQATPQPGKLKIKRRTENKVTVLDLTGALDADSEMIVDDFIDSNSSGMGKEIILNFGNLRSVNGSGIGVLINALVRFKKSGGIVRLVNINPRLLGVFDVHRVLPALNIYPDMRSALNQINKER